MTDNPRIDDLRRRVQRDPASIAFAQLAEEYRRAGRHREAVDACRSGLRIHPTYLSARVTLGRSLLELGELDEAQRELDAVLAGAPENLSAIRGLAEIHHRRGALGAALAQYRVALGLARNDPDLEQTVAELQHRLDTAPPPEAPAPAESFPHSVAMPLPAATTVDPERDRGSRTVAALEQWLAAIHAASADRRA